MKTLQQVEPRTPISSLPFTISTPGSYYLTGNLDFTAPAGDAIVIAANDVTLDLGGFALFSSVQVTGAAVSIVAPARNVTVRNGQIAGKTVVTVTGTFPNRQWSATLGGFARGVSAVGVGVEHVRLQDLVVTGCRLTGIELFSVGGIVERCSADGNGGGGFFAPRSAVIASTARRNRLTGFNTALGRLQSCGAYENGGGGFFGNQASFENCVAADNGEIGFAGDGAAHAGSVAQRNQLAGFSGDGLSLANCTSRENGGAGFALANSSATNCVAQANTGAGFSAVDSVVSHCVARGNGSFGYLMTNGTLVFSRSGNNATAYSLAGVVHTGNSPSP